MNDIESLRSCFAIHDPEMERNIGRLATYLSGQPQERLVKIAGVQKIWDYDEEGKYRFGVAGYTVQELADAFLADPITGERIRLYGTFACSKSKLTFRD